MFHRCNTNIFRAELRTRQAQTTLELEADQRYQAAMGKTACCFPKGVLQSLGALQYQVDFLPSLSTVTQRLGIVCGARVEKLKVTKITVSVNNFLINAAFPLLQWRFFHQVYALPTFKFNSILTTFSITHVCHLFQYCPVNSFLWETVS